eukprot:GFYU01023347.1.p1 GENE.GFYU01023347.1~~GFYU01023347.1.p1  ORF type:complete len:203 (-),score=53.41 GFYU01023347.1:262-810(-)
MHSYYGPTTPSGTYGIALLSKFPISSARTHFLHSEGEQVAAISAEVTVGSTEVTVFVTHLGQIPGDLVTQTMAMAKLMSNKRHALMMCDCNMHPDSDYFQTVTSSKMSSSWLVKYPTGKAEDGTRGYTSTSDNPTETIDYIFITPDITPKTVSVITNAHGSDHMPIQARLTWSVPPEDDTDE